VGRFTADAKEILREIELQGQQRKLEQELERARRDPLATYRDKRWYPRFVVWELTLACNMRCGHCGSAAGKPRPDELSLDEMYRVVDELGELGCERVTLLGGEPLIHPHWVDLARRMKERGYRANVITNGWTLHKPEVCDQLMEAELTIVGISVDGLAASHDRLRNRPGSFVRIEQGMDLLAEREVPVAASTVITNDSIEELEELYAFLKDKDVKVWQLQIANPLGRMDQDNPLIIDPARLPELYDFVEQVQGREGDLRLDLSDNVGYYGEHEARGVRQKRPGTGAYWTGCHAGIQAMGIDSNGDIKGCQSLPSEPPYIAGNVRERPLGEIWADDGAFPYTRRWSLDRLEGVCAGCHYGPLCKAGCTSAALAHSGGIGDNPMCIYRVEQARG
jgi:radical SAM protein with 4Fe4S-binding SPASM domain